MYNDAEASGRSGTRRGHTARLVRLIVIFPIRIPHHCPHCPHGCTSTLVIISTIMLTAMLILHD
eukprot:6305541-Pyramimonas_sp.AAC.1